MNVMDAVAMACAGKKIRRASWDYGLYVEACNSVLGAIELICWSGPAHKSDGSPFEMAVTFLADDWEVIE